MQTASISRLARMLVVAVTAFVTLGISHSGTASASVPTSAIARIWIEPPAAYHFLDAAIDAAHTSVDLSMYELSDTAIEQALIRRARSGVDVRVILNADYDGVRENAAAVATLRAGSVHVVWAPAHQIFHAKYLVIDAKTAYIGTGNLVPSDYSSTRDFWVSDTRARDVGAIAATFDADFAGGGTSSHQSAGLVWSPGSMGALEALIASAHHSLLVENEEMDSTSIEDVLISAARRGVEVEVVMTEDSEWVAALTRLASSGVHVHVLGPSQVYIHAKVICADCSGGSGTVFIGSENFSTSSLTYNRELGIVTTSPAAVSAVRSAVVADYAKGSPVSGASTRRPVSGSGQGVTITSLLSPIDRGGYESLRAHSTKTDDACSLAVVLPSGYTSESQGLGAARANGAGNVSWSWRIGTSTDPGTARATVTCSGASASRDFTIT